MPYKNIEDQRRQRNAYQKKWYTANRDKIRQYAKTANRRYQLKCTYGLTEQDYALILTAQSSTCAICKFPFPHTPYVDHCHETGKVRGLLCLNCNAAIGHAKDNPDRLRAMADYLMRTSL